MMISFLVFFFTTKMEIFGSPPPPHEHRSGNSSSSSSSAAGQDARVGDQQNAKLAVLVRTRGGFLDVRRRPYWFGRAASARGNVERKPTKLLLNVTLQNSVGPVQVVMLPENTVHDLKKAVVEIYLREKRRPFLACTDPRSFVLHYSPFSLEGLNPEEQLKNLGSRNFFLCQKPGIGVKPSYMDKAAKAADESPFQFVKLMDFLL